MRFEISAASCVAILAALSEVNAHGVFIEAWGSLNPGYKGHGLGYRAGVPRTGTDQWPYQIDITVFANPAVRNDAHPPKYLSTGCGQSFRSIIDNMAVDNPAEYNKRKNDPWGMIYNWFSTYSHRLMNTTKEIELSIQSFRGKEKRFIQWKPGAQINIQVHQVNQDGAGPYRCRVDQVGLGHGKWSGWLPIRTNVPGAPYSFRAEGTLHNYPLVVNIPANIKCGGRFRYGNVVFENLCMLRCENLAKNGPFGGCIPFQQIVPPAKPVAKPKPKAKPTPKAPYNKPPTYNKPTPKPKPTPYTKPAPTKKPYYPRDLEEQLKLYYPRDLNEVASELQKRGYTPAEIKALSGGEYMDPKDKAALEASSPPAEMKKVLGDAIKANTEGNSTANIAKVISSSDEQPVQNDQVPVGHGVVVASGTAIPSAFDQNAADEAIATADAVMPSAGPDVSQTFAPEPVPTDAQSSGDDDADSAAADATSTSSSAASTTTATN
ncbi:hypothetical protein TWF694_005314 [Orbilia ellipsospora]|uniref:Uncharacterized protein n=1 Tax=Orbilia ellipsospora TaxID=2528407 RepID=A0AAV9WT27_9PEZI